MTDTEIIALKEEVRERDQRRCVDCGMTAGEHYAEYETRLHVHRVVPGSAYTVAGCVTLCQVCHRQRHRGTMSPFSLGTAGKPLPSTKPPPIPADALAFIRRRLRELRTRAGFTATGLAAAAGMSAAAVANIEAGHASPALGTLYALAKVLNCGINEIICDCPSCQS